MLGQYVDYVTGGDVKDPDDIAHGMGAVVRRGLQKIAIYRDDTGFSRHVGELRLTSVVSSIGTRRKRRGTVRVTAHASARWGRL